MLVVHGVGGALQDEVALKQLFSEFGECKQAAVRKRVDAESGEDTSWALVTMGSAASATAALKPALTSPEGKPLIVARFDAEKASNSTGVMGTSHAESHGHLYPEKESALVGAVVTSPRENDVAAVIVDIAGTQKARVQKYLRQIAELYWQLEQNGVIYTGSVLTHFSVDKEDNITLHALERVHKLSLNKVVPEGDEYSTSVMPPEVARHYLAHEKHLRTVCIPDISGQTEEQLKNVFCEFGQCESVAMYPGKNTGRALVVMDSIESAHIAQKSTHRDFDTRMADEKDNPNLPIYKRSVSHAIWTFGLLLYRASNLGGASLFYRDTMDNLVNDEDFHTLAYRWDTIKFDKLTAVMWPDARELILQCLQADSLHGFQSFKDVVEHPFLACGHLAVLKELMAADRVVQNFMEQSVRSSTVTWREWVGRQAKQLHRAITAKQDVAVAKMFEAGTVHVTMVNPSFATQFESTVQPLHRAAFVGHVETMKVLLSKIGSDWPASERAKVLDCRTFLGYTPIMIARQCGHSGVADLLKTCGCKLELTNHYGLTAQDLHDVYEQEKKQQQLTPWRHAYQLWLSTANLEHYLDLVRNSFESPSFQHGIRIWNAKLVVVHYTFAQMQSLLSDMYSRLPKSLDIALHFTSLETARNACLGSPGLRASRVGQLGGGLSVSLLLLDELGWVKGGACGGCITKTPTGEDANFHFAMVVAGRLWGTKWFEVMPGPLPPDLHQRKIELPHADPQFAFKPRLLTQAELDAAQAKKHGKPVWGSQARKLEAAFIVRVDRSPRETHPERIVPGRSDVYILSKGDCVDWNRGKGRYYPTSRFEALFVTHVPGDVNAATNVLDRLSRKGRSGADRRKNVGFTSSRSQVKLNANSSTFVANRVQITLKSASLSPPRHELAPPVNTPHEPDCTVGTILLGPDRNELIPMAESSPDPGFVQSIDSKQEAKSSIDKHGVGVAAIPADIRIGDSVEAKTLPGDLRKTVLAYTAVVAPASNISSVLERHRDAGHVRTVLWPESVARYTVDEMRAGVTEVEQLMPHSHTMAFYYTTLKDAQRMCIGSECVGGIEADRSGLQVCLQSPAALGWCKNAGGEFKQNVAQLMELKAEEIQVMIVLQLPRMAIPREQLTTTKPKSQAGNSKNLQLRLELHRSLSVDRELMMTQNTSTFVIPQTLLTELETGHVVYANKHIRKIYELIEGKRYDNYDDDDDDDDDDGASVGNMCSPLPSLAPPSAFSSATTEKESLVRGAQETTSDDSALALPLQSPLRRSIIKQRSKEGAEGEFEYKVRTKQVVASDSTEGAVTDDWMGAEHVTPEMIRRFEGKWDKKQRKMEAKKKQRQDQHQQGEEP
eukprot:COSAG01_NODE_1554_length_9930_cov_19.371478_2_plen_1346_part_00